MVLHFLNCLFGFSFFSPLPLQYSIFLISPSFLHLHLLSCRTSEPLCPLSHKILKQLLKARYPEDLFNIPDYPKNDTKAWSSRCIMHPRMPRWEVTPVVVFRMKVGNCNSVVVPWTFSGVFRVFFFSMLAYGFNISELYSYGPIAILQKSRNLALLVKYVHKICGGRQGLSKK